MQVFAFILGVLDGDFTWPRYALYHPHRRAYDAGRRAEALYPVLILVSFVGFCVGLHFGLKAVEVLVEKIFG